MASILERLDDLIRGSLHRFVDRALEKNSLVLYDQDVRDMEAAIDHLEEATVTMYAAARANERRVVQHQEEVEKLERRVKRLTAEGVPPTSERMMVAQGQLEVARGLVAETQAQIERQQGQYETLAKQAAETRVREQALKDTRPRLESLLALARAYRSVEQVEMTLEGLRALGGDTEVAAVANSIHQRFNEAQARLEAIEKTEDLEMLVELEHAELTDQLAERRKRLGLAAGEEEPAPATPAPTPEPAPEQPAGTPTDAPSDVPTDAEPTDPGTPEEPGEPSV